MIKRITMFVATALLALTMAVPAIAAPADPMRQSSTGPNQVQGPTDPTPGTCTESTQKGANVTTTTNKGSCQSQGGQETTDDSKNPPGRDK